MQEIENGLPPGNHKSTLALIEAALFLSRDPLSFEQLRKICHVTVQKLGEALNALRNGLEKEDRGLVLLETDKGYLLGTRPELALHLTELLEEKKSVSTSLSDAALEVLAIIAFKQPLTRMEVEKIRGINSEGVLDNLLGRGLIETRGRKETLGKPFLYGITPEFLQYFGLKDASELKELEKIVEENGWQTD
jgi:segregation and condensation protein B